MASSGMLLPVALVRTTGSNIPEDVILKVSVRVTEFHQNLY
jgi:hypothetical protein